ncbi:EAL domain-containing protein [Rhodanobacter denitrificans]|uniref:Diguanylate cyclase n=2 Tax=Rhodanobacter TaxID=75309 RepID=A0A154QL46_9GAMM|nr:MULTISPECIES: EAL domain-containing protein [Rhodanobacter]AGG87775.1 diguanylate cyclase (GGDEF) domain-containing protein [Rhodanobacter denitrificans]EIM02540.1 diguanylate cyclase [Rhodanobacter denitrificans]KZC24485.1 diguanylate cyclase [Rhodanobacter thiooxydans]UJJ59542.1 EAL domain-containing protein [Rhodanobacter denitrificans]UJM86940.1 EAL domain-containing protein [Rhodanobacter denitrificans]
MSASPTIRSSQPPPVARDLAALHAAVERLFEAPDAAGVMDVCELMLDNFGIHGRLRWRRMDEQPGHLAGQMDLAEDPQGPRTLVLEWADLPLPEALRDRLDWLGRLADIRLHQLAETSHLYEAISRLALAERLQRALYAIAEQAGADHDMPEMMRSLHAIVSSLMYAENFYIVLYDAATDTVRFPYYVDIADTDPPPPDQHLPLHGMLHSLTWNLLQEGRPLMGSFEELKQQFGDRFVPIGPSCEHWLGAPLLRTGRVVGGIVMQSYRADTHYSRHDLELLNYVAQHVQTALERREAHLELGRRVTDRTAALREANRVLRQQVLQRQRGERLQAALFRIAELANTSDSLDKFYAAMHQVISGLLYARNFYIALIDEENGHLTFPYSVDDMDSVRPPRAHGRGATEYVLRHAKPLLATPAEIDRLSALGEISLFGARSVCWLGVPLIWGGKAMGVLALQSYSPEHTYNERDQELLTFVSYHIANALQRKQAATALKQAYAGLERRVTERTRALALANRDLREQIAERERVERRLKYETLHDSLTGLPNRTLLLQRLEQAMQRYAANPGEQFAVLFIDLDRFKVINDSVGHLVGDDLLFQVGGRIRACLKTRDVVARLGGDEFAVLLEGIVETGKATLIAERIISELQTPFRLGTKEIFTSASIGIALARPHYRQPEELLRDADAAMYNAKDGGRHRAAMFDDRLRREALSLLDMESDLRHALSRNEFEPFYQPIVELADGRITGYEALLRWHHPERGLLPPHDFLLIAEECGCAEAIDWQIFEQVCTQAVRLIGTDGFISINVSGRHFRSADLDLRLLALFDQYAVPTRCIRIEVTEHALLENPTQVKQMLQNLRSHGVGIALDDFGTGYSSLSYLHQYPFETLKIDRSFITELPPDDAETQGLALVRAIQVLADSLRMKVIAEGIEEESQRQALLRVGCRYGQGFLFAEAQPASTWLGADKPLLLA